LFERFGTSCSIKSLAPEVAFVMLHIAIEPPMKTDSSTLKSAAEANARLQGDLEKDTAFVHSGVAKEPTVLPPRARCHEASLLVLGPSVLLMDEAEPVRGPLPIYDWRSTIRSRLHSLFQAIRLEGP